MSTEYSIRCARHGARLDGDLVGGWKSYRVPALHAIIQYAETIADVAAIAPVDARLGEVSVSVRIADVDVTDFMVEHRGCVLDVVDEYGRVVDEHGGPV